METVEKIDSDVESLNSELDRHDGKRRFHCDKRCKYFLVGVGLLLAMFLFGMITRPTPKTVTVTVTEVVAVLDIEAPRVVQPELDERISHLRKVSRNVSAPLSVLTSTATEPRILTWTPASVGKKNTDGTPAPLVGSYEVPGGWFGAIRLLADGEEIGSTVVDVRSIASASQGRFSISPRPIEGEKSIHLVFDAVKACRIACDPLDQLCMATNVNYCMPLYDNQTFDTYIPKMAVALPPPGQCVTKVFVGGPKYAPQIPEDYTMCEKGMWNSNIGQEAEVWLTTNLGERVTQADVGALASSLSPALASGSGLESIPDGQSGNISWSVHYKKGEAELGNACMIELVVRVDCEDNTQASIRSVSEMFTQMSNKTREIGGVVVASLQSVFLPRVAYAQSERCGSAANVPAVDSPSSGLCDSGTPTFVYADSGVWNWLCLGPSGLASDPATQWCNAPYALPSTPPSVAPSSYTCGTWQYEMVPNPATQVVLNPNVSRPFVSNADFANYANQCAVYATNNSLAQYSCGVVAGGCHQELGNCINDQYLGWQCESVDVCSTALSIAPGPLVPAGPWVYPQEGISCTPIPVVLPPNIVNPGAIDYGAVPVTSPRSRSIPLYNSGGSTANVSLTLPSTPEGYWEQDAASFGTISINPGTTHTVVLTFNAGPVGGVPFSGALLVNGSNSLSIPVSGTISPVVGTAIQVERVGFSAPIADPIAIGSISPSAANRDFDFRITKTGPLDMPFQVSIQGGVAAGYSLSGTCSGTISAANPFDVCRVTFNPDASIPGGRSATILFDNQIAGPISGADPVRVNFTANVFSGSIGGVAAQPGPASPVGSSGTDFVVTFPPRPINSPVDQVVGITNTGDIAITGTCSNLNGPNFTTIGCGSITVPPGTPHLIRITFNPQDVVVPDAVLVIDADANNLPGGDIRIIVRGSGIALPSLTVNPTSVGFPSWDIYSGGITRDFTITNNGSVSSDVSLSVVLTGSNAGEFSVAPVTETIPPNGTPHTFTVTFDPDTVNGRTANIRITPDNAPQQTINVFGIGEIADPALLYVPNPLDFGRVVIPKTKTIILSITNNDVRDFGFPTLQIVGADAGAFTCPMCDDVGVPLNVGDTRHIPISFIPTAVGDYGDAVLQFVGGQNGITGYTIDINATAVRPLVKYEEN